MVCRPLYGARFISARFLYSKETHMKKGRKPKSHLHINSQKHHTAKEEINAPTPLMSSE
jgi:hypothetical protein